jgi:hypothetical protein
MHVIEWAFVVVGLGATAWTLWTGSIHLKDWEVTRTGDPSTYWLLVAVELGVCGYFLYRALSE